MGPFKRYLRISNDGVILDIYVKSQGGTGYTHTHSKQKHPGIPLDPTPKKPVTSVTNEGLGRLGFPIVDGRNLANHLGCVKPFKFKC